MLPCHDVYIWCTSGQTNAQHIFFLPKTAQVSSKNTPSLSGVGRRDLLWNVKEMSSWNLTFLPSASRWRKAVVIQMFGIKRDKKRRRINEGKKRLAVWFLRMAVYYQARSAEEINRHHLESKCPNIMKGMRTEARWNMTFSKKENIFFSFWSLFIYFSSYLVGCATFVYIKGAPLCTHSSSPHAFFGAPFISWRHAELSVLPKEFPPALYWRGGKIRALSESSLIWACVTTSQRSSYKQKTSIHACAHLLCFPFLLVFHLSQLCFGFIPLYLIRMGTPTYTSRCPNLLEFGMIKSEVKLCFIC